MQTNKEQASYNLAQRQAFFAQLIADSGQLAVRAWLENTLASPLSGEYQWLEGGYRADPVALAQRISQLNRLVEFLDTTVESLARPVVAAQVTKDPHGLDDDAPLLKALLYYLRYYHDYPALETRFQRQQLLSLANIETDTANNNLPTYGLSGRGVQGETLGWEMFYQRREPLVLTGTNLVNVQQIAPVEGAMVYCFENPAVFHTFLRRLPRQACFCSGGQLNRATLRLLELLRQNGINVRYHGDFDPEGLLIADRLRQQFVNVHLFAYEAELYEKAISGAEISPRRLKQLDKLSDPVLIAIGELLRQTKNAGYQEYIIEDLLTFAQS